MRREQGKRNKMLQLTTTLIHNYINEIKIFSWLSVFQRQLGDAIHTRFMLHLVPTLSARAALQNLIEYKVDVFRYILVINSLGRRSDRVPPGCSGGMKDSCLPLHCKLPAPLCCVCPHHKLGSPKSHLIQPLFVPDPCHHL